MIEIRHTDGSSADLMGVFRALPEAVYRDDPVWAPDSEAAVTECLEDAAAGAIALDAVVATAGDRPLARAMAILDPSARDTAGAAEGWVGFFECAAGSLEAGVTVLRHCEPWLRSRGAVRVVAPRVDALRSGLLIDGFSLPHTIFTAHNPPFYLDVFAAAGYEVRTRMFGYSYSRARVPSLPELLPEGIRVRHPDPSRLDAELAGLEAFQAGVFGGGIGYVPRDRQTAGRMLGRLLAIMDLELVQVAEDDEGHVVGFLICLPDVWQRQRPVDRARWVSVAVAPGWRRRGVGIAMGVVLLERLLAKGYQTLDGSWVMEQNERAHFLSGLLGAEPGRVFALLTKEL
jgi:GNAT superfamily N-acetyltransferase